MATRSPNQFALDIEKWVEKAKGRTTTVIRKIALDLFRSVIYMSPVDTGRFRGNWQCSINIPASGVLETTDKNGSATFSKATGTAMQMSIGDAIYLVNNLPYAWRLETGWSKQQAPAGMVGVTLASYPGIADAAARSERN